MIQLEVLKVFKSNPNDRSVLEKLAALDTKFSEKTGEFKERSWYISFKKSNYATSFCFSSTDSFFKLWTYCTKIIYLNNTSIFNKYHWTKLLFSVCLYSNTSNSITPSTSPFCCNSTNCPCSCFNPSAGNRTSFIPISTIPLVPPTMNLSVR